LYNTEDGDVVLIGAKELILFCEKVNREATKETLDEFPIRRKEDVVHLCYKLFQNVIKKYMTSSIKVPENENVKLAVKNGYYKLDDVVAMTRLRNAIDSIQSTLRKRIYRKAGGTVFNTKIQKLGAVIKQLEFIEGVKIPVFVRLAREKLEENPNAKVCIFVNYNHSIDALMTDLAEYNPIKFNRSVNKELRQGLINKFQEPNNKHRLFIGNVATSATGIDLDDKYGNYPRYAFASSNFNILDLFQLTRRIYRIDTQSNAIFRFVFIKNATEVSVLNNLARKSNIMKETLDVQRESGIVFPGDFPKEEEE
jgi:SNF2 family DNA or RNA helicase